MKKIANLANLFTKHSKHTENKKPLSPVKIKTAPEPWGMSAEDALHVQYTGNR